MEEDYIFLEFDTEVINIFQCKLVLINANQFWKY